MCHTWDEMIDPHFDLQRRSDKRYDHQPPSVVEKEDVTVLWDVPINTDGKIKSNRPDLIIKIKWYKRCTFIDFAVPSDKNVYEKNKRNLKNIAATAVVKQGILEHIKKMPGNIKTDMIQTITLFGTAHILRKSVMDNS